MFEGVDERWTSDGKLREVWRGEESRCFWKAVKLRSGTTGPGFEIIYFLRCTQFHNKQHNGDNIGQEKAEEC
jgi:hypothetical protein